MVKPMPLSVHNMQSFLHIHFHLNALNHQICQYDADISFVFFIYLFLFFYADLIFPLFMILHDHFAPSVIHLSFRAIVHRVLG